MKNRFYLLMLLAVIGLTVTTVSCSNDDDTGIIDNTPSNLIVNLSGDNIAAIKKVTIDFKETNTGESTSVEATSSTTEVALKKGSYTIVANGIVQLTSGEEMEAGGNATLDLTQDNQNLNIKLGIKIFS